jgi:hypothetical protein
MGGNANVVGNADYRNVMQRRVWFSRLRSGHQQDTTQGRWWCLADREYKEMNVGGNAIILSDIE